MAPLEKAAGTGIRDPTNSMHSNPTCVHRVGPWTEVRRPTGRSPRWRGLAGEGSCCLPTSSDRRGRALGEGTWWGDQHRGDGALAYLQQRPSDSRERGVAARAPRVARAGPRTCGTAHGLSDLFRGHRALIRRDPEAPCPLSWLLCCVLLWKQRAAPVGSEG